MFSGVSGIFVQQNQSSGESASLTIQGSGTLKATGDSKYGIMIRGCNASAALTIESSPIEASTSSTNRSDVGVLVQSGKNDSNPTLSITVDGGSLSVGGNTSYGGMQCNVGNADASDPTTSLTVSGNATVRAENGIKAWKSSENISDKIAFGSDSAGSNGGIVFIVSSKNASRAML